MPEKRFKSPSQVELIEKGSRFIGLAYPCENLDQLKDLQDIVQKQYRDASHVTFAYRIQDASGLHIRCSDAGEPSGTAGRPILSHIEGRDIMNIVIFVVRYFGGTKLGAGGLVRAYGATAKEALETGEIEDLIPLDTIDIVIPYELKQQLDYQLNKLEGSIVSVDYAAEITLSVRLPSKNRQIFLDRLGITSLS
ncbi:MAG: IMPACT family protein [Oligoflexus sp.]